MKALSWIITYPWRAIGVVVTLGGLYGAYLRFTQGLGAVTNLSDSFPWGMWVGFDVMCGVMLAAGGFTISALVYIFQVKKWQPIARPAVLTAFLGYLLVVGGLEFDLGHPFKVWHPLVMWNHHSVMWEVAWCVTLYTSVLAMEFATFVFEKLNWDKLSRVFHHLTFPLTLAAVLLSMLHQSSLGSLFLLVPERLHALWYTPLLPVLFFVSAIAVGLSMTIVESNLSARAFGRCIEGPILQSVAKVAAWVMGFYAVLRIGDLVQRGALSTLWPLNRAAGFFLVEIIFGLLIPLVIFSYPHFRHNTRLLNRGAQLAVLGFIMHRLNVGITGFEVVAGKTYTPAWTEIAVSLMLVAIGVTAFNLAGRYLPIFETEDPERLKVWAQEKKRLAALEFSRASSVPDPR
jgi:Ni/Fe-hydrogenase subunit HybB-like protein